MMEDTPFFVIGSGRSGTTLLRLILAGHSRLHIPPETWFIEDLVRELPLSEPLAPAEVDRAVEIMTTHYRWPDMEIPAEHLRLWAARLAKPKLSDVIDLVYYHQLQTHGKRRFGDKTPRYFEVVPQLVTLYPGAKFIHLIRDGRDVAVSRIDVDWDRYYERSFMWTSAMRYRRAYSSTPYSERILDVKYEDLVSDPEATIKHICDFLNEKFEPAMLEWQKSIDFIPIRERRIHRRLNQTISSEAIGVWKKKLTAVECFMMEACLYKDLLWAGYRLRYAGLAWRPLLAAGGWLLHSIAPLLRRGIPYLQRRGLFPKTVYL